MTCPPVARAPHPETLLSHAGRTPAEYGGFVNTPLFRGSTILAASYGEWQAAKQAGNPYAHYGRFGSPTTRALESAIAELEGAAHAMVFPSGLSACTHALMAFLQQGDHILITDNVYGPTRAFAENVLKRFGVTVEYFDPCLGAGIARQLRPNTRVVFAELPGSLTFEMSDLPAIAHAAHAVGATVIVDNSWASPLYFRPFEHGADVSIQAATKYILGHSDALLGTVSCTEAAWERLAASAHDFGETAGPEEVYLALRGLRTLAVRLKQHWQTGVALAESLVEHPAVARVLHPALPQDPGHALWKRDFLGASGLFSIVLHSEDCEQLACFFDHLQLFGIGLSWGGFESLALPVGRPLRSARPWPAQGTVVRIHAGLEHADDLIADLHQALDAAFPQATPRYAVKAA